MRKDGVLYVLTQDKPNTSTDKAAQINRFNGDNHMDHHHIVINLGEESETIVTSLLMSDAMIKEVWKKVTDNYQKENIQSKLKLRNRLQNFI